MIDNKTKSTLAVTVSVIALLTYSSSAYAVSFSTFADFDVNDMHNTHTRLPLELKSTPSNSYKLASVCSLGTGNCSSESDLNSNTSQNNINKRKKCIEDGYSITFDSCNVANGYYPIDMCPYHSQYFRNCADCTAYTFSQCPDNSVCTQCHNKKYKVSSCKNGYELTGSTCQCPELVTIDTGEKCSQSCEGNCVEKVCKSAVSLTNPNDICTQKCAQNSSICTSKSCTPTPDAAIDCVNGVADESDGCGGIRKVCKPDTPQAKCTREGYTQNITCNLYDDKVSCSGDSSYQKCAASCKSRIKERYGNTIHFDNEYPNPYSSSTTTILTQDANSNSIYLKAKIRSYLSYTDISECAALKTSKGGQVPTLTMPSYFSSITDIQDVNVNTQLSSNQVVLRGRIANSVITFTNAVKDSPIYIDSSNKLKIAGVVTIQSAYPSSYPLLMRLEHNRNQDVTLEIANNSVFTFKGGIGCNLNGSYCTVYNPEGAFAYNGIAIGTDSTVNIEGDICYYGNRDRLERAIIVGNNSNLNIIRGTNLVSLCLRETVVYIYGGAQVKLKGFCLLSWNKEIESQKAAIYLRGLNAQVYNTNWGVSLRNDSTAYVTNRTHNADFNAWCDRDTVNNNGRPSYQTLNFSCDRYNAYSNPQCSIAFEGLPNAIGNPVCY